MKQKKQFCIPEAEDKMQHTPHYERSIPLQRDKIHVDWDAFYKQDYKHSEMAYPTKGGVSTHKMPATRPH
jgi:hypothetical protein